MTRVELLERQIKDLSDGELAEFRRWFEEFDAVTWDRQIEADAESGKLDALADAALTKHAAGQTTPL
jgi:hypothetical protein